MPTRWHDKYFILCHPVIINCIKHSPPRLHQFPNRPQQLRTSYPKLKLNFLNSPYTNLIPAHFHIQSTPFAPFQFVQSPIWKKADSPPKTSIEETRFASQKRLASFPSHTTHVTEKGGAGWLAVRQYPPLRRSAPAPLPPLQLASFVVLYDDRSAQWRQCQSYPIPETNECNGLVAAFSYDVSIDYSNYQCVVIGSMNLVCSHCKALKYKNEANGLCCANGIGTDSIHFLTHIQQYNNCFQMTSFGATNAVRENFMPTFKIQGQIYHRAGSLLPVSDSDNKFLQIYFMGNSPQEIDLRCAHNNLVKRSIVEQLQTLFHQHNQLIILFKTALDLMPSDNHKIVIRADKTPAVGENLESRDIVLHRRNFQLQPIKETHRSYDALQYPIIFWQGEDGYDLSIKMINPITGSETNKKVSSMNYYSYRLMIRENADNHILKCRRLYHKYVDDMYVKIETERLTFIRLNQTKLRSEEYIHLRDAINTDGNAQNVGRMTILPATYIGSPRHMHEYAQDAMSYVRHYGTADLFITFICNPQWIEIKQELLPGKSSIDRHDITARYFRQKLKSLMNFIVKHNVFGETRCWMYSVEWQKRGLPHAHILIWLVEKIRPNEVDAVISAEIPNVQVDPGLHEVVIKNMIHGPCGTLNENSPCMMDEFSVRKIFSNWKFETLVQNSPSSCRTLKIVNGDSNKRFRKGGNGTMRGETTAGTTSGVVGMEEEEEEAEYPLQERSTKRTSKKEKCRSESSFADKDLRIIIMASAEAVLASSGRPWFFYQKVDFSTEYREEFVHFSFVRHDQSIIICDSKLFPQLCSDCCILNE
ncbi:uncharacterized protein LOC143189877 [Rhynchophorus ferrugineus]|uniref:uncharacterized protein LOC143189877 n=1 Tax=Rhynchophorus ferrugineus TaxID=354439 RepID=UPI003FCC31B9